MEEILLYRHLNCCKMDFQLVYPIVTCLKLSIMLRIAISNTKEVVKDTQTQNYSNHEMTTECPLASFTSIKKG